MDRLESVLLRAHEILSEYQDNLREIKGQMAPGVYIEETSDAVHEELNSILGELETFQSGGAISGGPARLAATTLSCVIHLRDVLLRRPVPKTLPIFGLADELIEGLSQSSDHAVAKPNATLSVRFANEQTTSGELVRIASAIDGLATAAVFGRLLGPLSHTEESKDDDTLAALKLCPPIILVSDTLDFTRRKRDSRSPFDTFASTSYRNWAMHTAIGQDRDLYHRIFGFSEISRVERQSPILIELCVAIPAALSLSAAVTIGAMKIAASDRNAHRLADAEARIREADAVIREQEAEQKQQQTRIMTAIADVAEEYGVEVVEPETIRIAAAHAAAPVAELAKSPLIENVSLGFSNSSS